MSPANDLNPAFRPRWTGVLTLYLLAITIGAASAWLAVRSQLDSGGVSAGVWRTSTLAGSTDADLYTRAVIAVGALLALNRDETMYYVALQQDAVLRVADEAQVAARHRTVGALDVDGEVCTVVAVAGEERVADRDVAVVHVQAVICILIYT